MIPTTAEAETTITRRNSANSRDNNDDAYSSSLSPSYTLPEDPNIKKTKKTKKKITKSKLDEAADNYDIQTPTKSRFVSFKNNNNNSSQTQRRSKLKSIETTVSATKPGREREQTNRAYALVESTQEKKHSDKSSSKSNNSVY